MSRYESGRGRAQRQPLDKVRAPYNFVPLAERVVSVPWAEQIQQDCPFEGGVCGRFELRLRAHGPLFVKGPDGGFFKTPDGKPAIPGTSIRGMLRAVMEIATFSRMDRVNDHTYGVRDLHNRPLYGRHMAEMVRAPNGKKQPMPLVSAGWLRRANRSEGGGTVAHIIPCSFAKIHYNLLTDQAGTLGINGYNPGEPQRAPQKYDAWREESLQLAVTVQTLLESNPVHGSPRIGHFGKVTRIGGPTEGTLVFTGQPSRWPAQNKRSGGGNPKQHDFFFHTCLRDEQLPVSEKVFRAFEFVHSDAGEQHRISVAPNAEWDYWKDRAFDRNGEVPVFFLLDERGQLRAFGLAMMFRLAYDLSTLDVVQNVQGKPVQGELDMARAIFGHVPPNGGQSGGRHGGLKSRVSVGLGRLEGGGYKRLKKQRVVLGSPKASYYPNYLEQGDSPGDSPATGRDGKPRYRTYMDANARPRGWKRYVQRTGISKPELPTRADGGRLENEKIIADLRPLELAEGAYFRVPIRVHNLRPEELGALLWMLDFGGYPGTRHGLGMAKSLGYGSVSLAVDVERLGELFTIGEGGERRPITEEGLLAAREAFAGFMEQQLEDCPGGWAGSRQLHELLAMACPPDASDDLRHMRIHKKNEFVQAKKDGLALRPRGADTWRAPRRRGAKPEPPRQAVVEGWVRVAVRYSPNNGELSTTVKGVVATATRGEALALLTSLTPNEAKRLKKKKIRNYEVRVDIVGNRQRIAAMRTTS